ncbi:MAG: NADPH-dependent F420 reductase [Candidatus Kariarchaeaceae archaeon]
MSDYKIGLIGGTGDQGMGIALRLGLAGVPTIIGSRTLDKAETKAAELNAIIGKEMVKGMANEECVANSNVVMLTVNVRAFENAISIVEALLPHFQPETIFVDVTVPLIVEKGTGSVMTDLPEHSASETLRKVIPKEYPVVGAFKTVSAHALLHHETPLNRDTFVYGDKKARPIIQEIAAKIEGLRPVIAGPLRSARTIEGMTAMLITLNKFNKVSDTGFITVGI